MPYRSLRQERFFHTPTARAKGITGAVVREFDQSSKGMKLPERSLKHVIHAAIVGHQPKPFKKFKG